MRKRLEPRRKAATGLSELTLVSERRKRLERGERGTAESVTAARRMRPKTSKEKKR